MPYVYSTLTNTNFFPVYAKNDSKSLGLVLKNIEIKGGHGVKDQNQLFTPRGVVTKVTDEELKLLEQDYSFKKHVKDGFITVDDKNVDPAKRAVDMAPKDGSAPLTPKDFEESEMSSPETKIFKKKGSQ